MAGGGFSKARMMLQDNWLQHRNWLIAEMDRLSQLPIPRLLALAEKLSKPEGRLAESLEIIKVWFRDLVVSHYDAAKIVNLDVADKVQNASRKNKLTELLSIVDAVQKTQNRLAANTNLRLTMESLLIRLAQS